MKTAIALWAALALFFSGSVAVAQMRPMTPAQPPQSQAPAGAPMPGPQSQPPMMGQGMMGMMCPMMGQSMMGMMPGMMGMPDPKAQARMLKLRGDMLKAMGEVMLKHGQALEQEK